MFSVHPSFSAGTSPHLASDLNSLSGLDHLHLDIDDGNFVHGITFGVETVRLVANQTTVPIDVHLEVCNPLTYVRPLGEIGISALAAHIEALPFPSEFIGMARAANISQVGLALNVKTPVSSIIPYIDQLNYVIIVSVEADASGLLFQYGALKKIEEASALDPRSLNVWVDGGICEKTLIEAVKRGATDAVAGRAVFNAADPVAEARRLSHVAALCEMERE